MNIEQQKNLFKEAIKSEMSIMHTEFGKSLDFADKFVELGNDFSKLKPDTQEKIIKAFLSIALASPIKFN